ncbi:MAG: HAD-IIIC family phosphatase [Pyrinomonadaceae bacterium]|nr:HAD-IIIC family phosphatase [Pyrinomonadaceae bacterium]
MQRIVITATFTAEPVNDPLCFLLKAMRNASAVEFAPYNQVFQQLLDPTSVCRSNLAGINVILVRLEDWGKFDINESSKIEFPSDVCEKVRRGVGEFISALRTAAQVSAVPYLLVICPPSSAALKEPELRDCLEELEQRISSELADVKSVHLVTPDELLTTYLVADYDDLEGSRLGHIPYTQSFFVALSSMIARRVYRLSNVSHKVIALDCDQTLWKGICGEVGAMGVEIDPSRLALQEFMVNQSKAGMLICLCSKNNEEDVFEVFDRRPEMPMRRDHIVSWRINWRPKSENLRSLASELNLGLDSFIFIDDDPAVCYEVQANCPEVLTLQLPQEPDAIVSFLGHVWAFDQSRLTKEDQDRTNLYKVNVEREQIRAHSDTLQDFLAGLGLEIVIAPLLPAQVPRVSQLTQRTNQFNFTTVRRTDSEIEQFCETGLVECHVVNVNDRFGDYGLVGAMIFQAKENALAVDTVLLSCRALGRGVEHRMIAHLGVIALERGLEYVEINYLPTAKNRPAYEFISQIEAEEVQTVENGTLFRVRAAVAVTIRLDGSTQIKARLTEDNLERNESTQAANASTISSFLARVPAELSTVDQIANAVLAEKSLLRQAAGPMVMPEDRVEAQLKTIWEGVLGVSPIGVDDNYFELGGDSFQAVRLFSEIERGFGRHLPLVTLLSASTIRQLASRLRDAPGEKAWSALVAIQPLGSRPPFYCMHAAGGDVLFYRDLAKHLGLDQPLYGLQARGVDRNQTTHDSVEEMAEYYLNEIRAFQPEGPYHLGGSSFGGLVAFEMARQLENQGQVVALLVLFDTYGPGYPKLMPGSTSLTRWFARCIQRVRSLHRTLDLLTSREKLSYLVAKTRKLQKKLVRKLAWKKNEIAIAFNSATGGQLPKDVQRNHKAIDRALRSYKPKPYGGRLTLFRAASQPPGVVRDNSLGWHGMARGSLEIHEVPGFHGAVTVDPYAKVLAEKLAPCLRVAQRLYEEEAMTSSPYRSHGDAEESVLLTWRDSDVESLSAT